MKEIIKDLIPPIILKLILFIRKKGRKNVDGVDLEWKYLSGEFSDIKFLLNYRFPHNKIYLSNSFDSCIYEKMKTLKNMNTIYDAGAFFGYHTLKFTKYIPHDGHIYAFEPNPYNRDRLLLNVKENKHLTDMITVHEFALSNKEEFHDFYFNEFIDSGSSSTSSLTNPYEFKALSERTILKTTTIDNLITKGLIKKPDLIKIDVEGAEDVLLEGAINTLKMYKPYIFIEVHTILDMFNVFNTLLACDYTLELLKEEKDGRCMFFCFKN